MIRKTIGTILIALASVLFIILLTGGRLIFPHILGPITLALIGAILLTLKEKGHNPTK
jgi:hypothetical protein